MKVTFDKQKLLGALVQAAGISQTKNTLVSVDGLLFECPPNPKFGDYDTDRDDLCRISAFDLEKGLRTTIECRVHEKGMFVINTQKILQIVRALPDGDVTLNIDDKGHVKVEAGYSHFEITASPGEEFPSMPMYIGDKIYNIPQYKIRNLINETVFAVTQNDQRAAFNGGYFKIRDGYMTAVGCDGNRLSAARCKLSDNAEEIPDAEMIIPGRFLNELTKLLRDTEDEVKIIAARRHIFFNIDNTYFFTRLLEAEYINYEKLLPKTYMTEVFISKNELLGAVERASIVTENKLGGGGRSVDHVKIDFADNNVTMSSISSGGSVFEKIPASITGNDITIGFNCRYLLDALRACPADCDTIRIRLNAPLMGIIIEPAGGTPFVDASPDVTVYGERKLDVKGDDKNPDGDSDVFMYLVMPVRMNK